MIGWQNAAALWALPLAALPFVIHLLRTHHAKRVAFPSLRFVPRSRAAAVRMRLPSDVVLMVLRMAIVALAVGALAGPIVLTDARTAAWNARTARAVVVDSSDSMRTPDGSGVAPHAAAVEAAEAELRTATYGHRVDAGDLEEGLARASRWLTTSPPARREIVVFSDLQRGSLRRPGTAAIADGIGVRFVPIGRPAAARTFDGERLFGEGEVAVRAQIIEAAPDATAVVVEERPGNRARGVRLIGAPGSEGDIARLRRTVAIAGAPDGAAGEPLVVRFTGAAPDSAPLAPVKRGWMLRTVLRLREDSTLAMPFTSQALSQPGSTGSEPWTILARDGAGSARVRAAAAGGELILDVVALPDSLFAAQALQAALRARADVTGYDEQEIARVDEKTLSASSRSPGPVTRGAWRTAESTDARWFWLLAIVLLGVEQWLRARSAPHHQQEVARAAA